LLVLNRNTGEIDDKRYVDIVEFLNPGDVLVLNNSKVIKARLKAVNENGSPREILILEKHSFDNDWHQHRVLYRGKLKQGEVLKVGPTVIVVLQILGDGLALVKSDQDLLELAEKSGKVPLPPYLNREATDEDVDRYQTVWAKQTGSVAAPTASLNMTKEILDILMAKGVNVVYITLHVGLGTFLPIRADRLENHKMHQEYFEIPKETVLAIQDAKESGRAIIALGTTVARTLEFASEVLSKDPSDLSGEADIFIYPGYEFRVVNHLITNFHAPKSTVLMLTAAFTGWDKLLPAYEHAIEQQYALLSYGDSMLIL
jgi:S-adenosylmethionine:tRNA ribosyltransferase-isomerase